MRTFRIFAFSLLLFTTIMTERVLADATAGAHIVQGELIYVLCANNVRVHSEDLSQIEFTSGNFERIRPFQGWGQNKKSMEVNGKTETFVRVQFAVSTNRKTDVGWVPEEYVKLKSDCAGSDLPPAPVAHDTLGSVTGIDDSHCCLFPIKSRPLESFTTGPRQFGASRLTDEGGFRKHAANDLYADLYSDVQAVAPGTVIYSPQDFYMMTKEVAVKHPGGFVARYGEITPKKNAPGIEGGVKVHTGQIVGYVGHTFSSKQHRFVAPPMLHFELYSGKLTGALTDKSKSHYPFYRRRDLMDPTKYLEHWEQISFN